MPPEGVHHRRTDVTSRQGPPPDGLSACRPGAWGLTPAECVVIEDAPAGIQAGRAAGMQVIAVGTTLAEEALSLADVVIGQLAEIHLTVSPTEIQIRFDP